MLCKCGVDMKVIDVDYSTVWDEKGNQWQEGYITWRCPECGRVCVESGDEWIDEEHNSHYRISSVDWMDDFV